MAEVLTIGVDDLSANIHGDSLKIEQVAGEFSAVCSVKLNDLDSTLTIETRDPVTVVDNGTTLFAGEVADIDADLLSLALGGRRLTVQCRDYQILVEEAVIDGEEAYSAQADSAIIADLFSTYRPDIDATTYVSTLQGSMTISFADVTLREALSEICGRTGGRWYVDELMNLHYFDAEANVAAWYLSDTPDNVTSFPYQQIAEHLNGLPIVNRFLTVGKGVRGWRQDNASIAAYGVRPAVGIDNRITTMTGVEERGDAILAKYAQPRFGYAVTTRKEGLRAGMDVRLVCGAWGVDETLTIQRLTIYWRADARFYSLEIGEGMAQALTKGRIWLDRIDQVESIATSLDGTVFDVDAPAAPAALGAGNVTTGVSLDADGAQIVWAEITWGSVADPDLDHYELQLSTQNDFSSDVETRYIASDADRIQRFMGLVGNITYYVRVRAVDWVGNTGAWDYGGGSAYSFTSSRDTDAPAQVAGLAAGSSRTLVGLYWTANSEADLLHYEIQRAPDVTGAPGAWATIALADLNFYTDQDFTDGEIAAADTFWYRVRAVDRSQNAGTWAAQTSVPLGQIVGDHIAALTIVGGHIAANTITAGKMNVAQLSAIAADLGTITAGLVTGATVRTAAAGARVVLDSTDGIRTFNAGGVMTAQLDVDGSGQLGASTLEPIVWNAAGQLDKLKANQLDIGDKGLFNAADGLLLLGPGCELTATSWKSLRGQVATIANAFQTMRGAFPGTQGIVMEPGCTNLVTNPSFGIDTTGYGCGAGNAIERTDWQSRYDGYSLKCTDNGDTDLAYLPLTLTAALYYASVWVFVTPDWWDGGDISVSFEGFAGASPVVDKQWTVGDRTGVWVRLISHITPDAGDVEGYLVIRSSGVATAGRYIYTDGWQLEATRHTTTCIGSMSWCAWSDGVHASTSTRVATTMQIATGGNVSGAAGSIEIWFRLDGAYNSSGGCLVSAGNAWDEFFCTISPAGILQFLINGAERCAVAGVTLDVDHCAVFTWDSVGDTSELFLDGVSVDTGTCGGGAWTRGTNMGIGYDPNVGAIYNLCGAVTEFAVFGDLLTANEVAAIWNLRRAMVDHGAIDAPGIYITDGKFRISSSYTGSRIEMTAEEIATWNMADKINEIDSDGISILVSTSFYDIRSYQFRTSTGTVVSRLAGYYNAGGTANVVELRANDFAGIDSAINVQAESPTGRVANVTASAYHGAAKYADLSLNVSAGEVSTIIAVIDTTPRLTINASGITVGGALVVAGAVTGVTTLTASGDIQGDEIKTDGANTDGTQRWQLGGRQPSGDFAMTGYVEIWIGGSKWLLGCATG